MENFKVGDTVLLDIYNKKATIEKINNQSACDSGVLYTVVTEDGEQKVISSTFLKEVITNHNSSDKNIDTKKIDKVTKKQMIEKEIERVINELGLANSTDDMTQLNNCTKVQEYIIRNFTYTDDIMDEKESMDPEDIILEELYNALILKRSVCTSNSIAFKEILSRVGTIVKTIGAISRENGKPHFSNIVLLNGEYYFFDTTLDQTIYLSQNGTDEIIFCCAGLGLETYGEYYEPKVELENPASAPLPLPQNISKYDIPNEIVNAQKCPKMNF